MHTEQIYLQLLIKLYIYNHNKNSHQAKELKNTTEYFTANKNVK